MAMRYPGGLIATSPVNAAYPSGVWTQSQTIPYASQNVWQNDQYWRNTTLLLHGDGTNGAQNNTFLDSSSNNFSITRNGNTTQGAFTPYQQNGYWSNYLSNATGSYIVAANNTSYVFGTGDFTVEFWVFWTGIGTGSDTRLMAIGSDYPSSGLGLVIYRTTGDTCKARVLGNSTGGTEYTIASGASDWSNKWVHMAVTRSGSTLRTFLNGTLITTATNSSDLNGTNGIQFGRYTGGGDLFTGYLSNVRLTKGGALYTASFTPPVISLTTTVSSGTVGFLGFQSNRFIDNSGNNIALTLTGTPLVQAFQPFPGATTWSASVLGGSGYFDGTGDYLNTGSSTAFALGTGDFTWEAWLYRTASATQEIYTSMTTNGLIIYISGGAAVVRQFGVADLLTSSASITLNTWTHIAVARSGTTLSMWINGSRSAGGTTTNSTNFAQSGLRIGINDVGSSAYTGYMSNLRVVKGTAVYDPTQTSITVPTAPLTNISNTSLLLNFTNAGIFDNAQMNDLETVGNAQVSTSVVKYGTGSMAFDGTGDYLVSAAGNTYISGTENFTIEGWLNLNSISSTQTIVSGNTSNSLFLRYGQGYTVTQGLNIGRQAVADCEYCAFTFATGTWYHIAVCRANGVIYFFVNGQQQTTQGSGASTYSFPITSTYNVGFYGVEPLNGYLDDLRITKGVARYISNFTPPIARMPNQ